MSRAGSEDRVELLREEGSANSQNQPRSLKRGREGSAEPSVTTQVAVADPHLATKKYRLEDDNQTAEDEEGVTSSPRIGEVRKKVEQLTHYETNSGKTIVAPPALETNAEADVSKDDAQNPEESSESATASGTKRQALERSSSSTLNDEKITDAKKQKEDSDIGAPSATGSIEMGGEEKDRIQTGIPQADSATTNDSAKKEPEMGNASAADNGPKPKQTSFASFSSASSPFATAKSNERQLPEPSKTHGLPTDVAERVKAANATSSNTSVAESASLPSAQPPKKAPTFGSFTATSSPFSKASGSSSAFATTSASSSTPSRANTTRTSAFGGWSKAAASPFATPAKPAAIAAEQTAESKEEKTAEGADNSEKFGDKLSKEKDAVEIAKRKLDLEEQAVHTGEEDEETIHQVRVKLYVMEDSAWKERGIGSLHLNLPKKEVGAPRLVLRAEGVLRLVLNVSLFAGMNVELADKFVRTVVMEDGQMQSIAIKTSTAKAAAELHARIIDNIPEEPKKSSNAGEPQTAEV